MQSGLFVKSTYKTILAPASVVPQGVSSTLGHEPFHGLFCFREGSHHKRPFLNTAKEKMRDLLGEIFLLTPDKSHFIFLSVVKNLLPIDYRDEKMVLRAA